MSFKIQELHLEGQSCSGYTINGEVGKLGDLAKINMFVGANNSGKSRFLRELCRIEQMHFVLNDSSDTYQSLTNNLKQAITTLLTANGLFDISGFLYKTNELPKNATIHEKSPYLQALKQLLSEMLNADMLTLFQSSDTKVRGEYPELNAALKGIATDVLQQLHSHFGQDDETIVFRRIYIPTLRSLRHLHDDDLFGQITKANYFHGKESIEVFTGQTLYSQLQSLLLGTLEERESVARFQEFLSGAFFDGKSVALIPRGGQKELFVKIGDERERPVYELGDGIQSIIILIFPIFQHRNDNILYFVEEPELFLHPGMQRIFLNALLREEFQNSQCFIATHSNHLLDLTLDINQISVFTFQKELDDTGAREKDSKTIVDNVSNEDCRTLQLLGTQNSAVFLSNCTIWVEGITDRRYLLHYLSLLHKHLCSSGKISGVAYKQDLHFSFVEYSGSNITHWSFLDEIADAIIVDRLCSRLFLVTDQDMSKGAKASRIDKLKTKLEGRYYCLKCREIENLITPKVLVEVLKTYEPELSSISEPRYQDYKFEYLGAFIENTLLAGRSQRRGTYKDKSGTISGKTEFCRRVVSATHDFEDLSLEAKLLTKKIFNFIQKHNPR